MSDGRVGPLVSALADGVRADLEEIGMALSEVRAKIEVLGESARAINGLADDCRGWSAHIEEIGRQVEKEKAEVPAKLLGKPLTPIAQYVDSGRLAAVRKAKEHEVGCELRHFSYEVGSGIDIPTCTCKEAA